MKALQDVSMSIFGIIKSHLKLAVQYEWEREQTFLGSFLVNQE